MAEAIITASVEGYEAARGAVERAIKVAKPEGRMGQAITFATTEAHRYAANVVHVDTGTLRSALTLRVSGSHGTVGVGPTINPKSHRPANRYAPFEEGRGGSHAFFERTVAEAGPGVVSRAIEMLKEGL